jgi:hypothetical protein
MTIGVSTTAPAPIPAKMKKAMFRLEPSDRCSSTTSSQRRTAERLSLVNDPSISRKTSHLLAVRPQVLDAEQVRFPQQTQAAGATPPIAAP